MSPSPRKVSSSRDDEEEKDSELQDQTSELDQQEGHSSPRMSLLAKGNEKRVDGYFCIGADEPELHKVSEADTLCISLLA